MKHSELVTALAERFPHLSRKDVDFAVHTLIDTMRDALAQGRRVEVRGFGNFQPTVRRAYTGRDPRNGDSIQVAERRQVRFKPGKALLESVNPGVAAPAPPTDGI